MEKKVIFLICFLVLQINLISADLKVGDGEIGLDLNIITPTNYSTLNVNNSLFWNNNLWSDTRWLNIDGSNADQNIDIGNYLFEAFQLGVDNAILDSAGFEIIDLALGTRTLNANNGFAMLDFSTMGTLDAMSNDFVTTGDVGIGTSSPAVKFVVQQSGGTLQSRVENTAPSGRALFAVKGNSAFFDMRAYGTTYSETFFGMNTADTSMVLGRYGKFLMGTHENEDFILGTNNIERARITNTGNIEIGNLIVDNYNLNSSGNLYINALGEDEAVYFNKDVEVGQNINVNNLIGVGDRIVHLGDTHTYIRFTLDQIDLYAGGMKMLSLDEAGQDKIYFNPNKANIDFVVDGDNIGGIIYTDANNDYLSHNGGFAHKQLTQTGAYTTTYQDHTILCEGTWTLTLGSIGVTGFELMIKNMDAGNIIIDPLGGVQIDEALTYTLGEKEGVIIQYDKTSGGWWIMAKT